MNLLKKSYYELTAYVPRMLPLTMADYEKLKDVFVNIYGIPDEPATWATVAGQISATPAHKLRKPWGHIANAAKRLRINAGANEVRTAAIRSFNYELEVAAKKEADRLDAEEKLKNDMQEKESVTPSHDEPKQEETKECASEENNVITNASESPHEFGLSYPYPITKP